MEFGSILLAVLGIGLLIFLHEGGHFLAARVAGVRVEVFSLGFGPRLGGFEWRGTDFRISAVPFGGYVMVAGQDPSDRRYPAKESLASKTVSQRALFWSGGVLVNLLFALAVFPLVFSAGVNFEAAVAGPVEAGSPAWEAGIEKGDRVLEVAGKPVYSMQNLAIEVALRGNRPVELLVEGPDGARRVVEASPRYDAEQGLYGLGLKPAYDEDAVTLRVNEGGVAAAAGLATGDRVLTVDGSQDAAVAPFEGLAPHTFVVDRAGEQITVTLTPTASQAISPPRIGVTPLAHRIAGMRSGAALADALGLQRGDVVLAIDGRAFLEGALDPAAYSSSTSPTTTWTVQRDGERVELRAEATPQTREALATRVAFDTEPRLQLFPTPDGAARAAGLQAGDWLVAIDGAEVADWDALKALVEKSAGRSLDLQLLRPDPAVVPATGDVPAGLPVALTITPQQPFTPDFGMTRTISPLMTEIRAESFGEAVKVGTVASLDLVKQLYVTMKRLITGEVGAKNLGGIIRISQVSYQAAQRGPTWFWYFLALLSVNLAFVNLLPIPVLDGGHLMFLLIEKVKGSPVSSKVFGYSQVIGLVCVLLLVLFVTYNDILRLL